MMISESLKKLFESLNLKLLNSNRYEPSGLAEAEVRKTLYFRRNRREFEDLKARYSESLPAALEVRLLGGILGYGLFSIDSLKAGDLIGEYTGIVRPARPGKPLPEGGYSSDYAWGFPKVRNFGPNLEIDARQAGGILRFANHSENPNAEAEHYASNGQWHVIFIAGRAITAGDEVTIDYGDAYWSGGERELITGTDRLPSTKLDLE